ncbi:hypothetical protein [Acidovorax sp. SUPP3334]|uniref:hypothetical protein n=1 Tax=Acidovorax sp. SUPP3334 TaxID=2920881 RepID=UPI0023DE4823|nr:hypothetical protein [Acidovorax sp. SUPP3334]GKT24878.1 hypothetical protein AVHM3334_16145 [Acidovorax sp. SUPP3334]
MNPPTAQPISLEEARRLWPEGLGEFPEALAQAVAATGAVCVQGDVSLPALDLGAPLATQALGTAAQSLPVAPALLIVQGTLRVAGAVTAPVGPAMPLLVCGDAHWGHAVLGSTAATITGALQVDGLLWCGGEGAANDAPGGPAPFALRIGGPLSAQVALFTGRHGLQAGGDVSVPYRFGAAHGDHDRAAFSAEPLAAVFEPSLIHRLAVGEPGRLDMLPDRPALLAALHAGQAVLRSPEQLAADLAHDTALCPGGAMHAAHLRQLLRSRLLDAAHKKAVGWFGATDFMLCRQHVDEDGDTYTDGLFMTVWKTWDFHLSIDDGTARQGWWRRLAARWRPTPEPRSDGLTVMHRRYAAGVPGPWEPLLEDGADPAAAQACEQAWQGVLDYARKAVAHARAGEPVWRRLVAALSAERIEALSQLPVFTERYNDWWDDERNGWWEGDVWVGVRQPCMHQGEPWGLALKLSWRNAEEAPGDPPDDAHAAYQIDIEASAPGTPPAVRIACAQRQSEPRRLLPHHAVDHAARLLRWFLALEDRLHATHGMQAPAEDTGQEHAAPDRG